MKQMTRVDKASQFCLIPVYVLHVILLKETNWFKLASIAVALWAKRGERGIFSLRTDVPPPSEKSPFSVGQPLEFTVTLMG